MERAAAEQASALPHVAQRVGAGRSLVLAHLDVPGVDSGADGKGAVLWLGLAALERGLNVAGFELAIAPDLDR